MSLLRGHFRGEADALMQRFGSSLDVDLPLLAEDLAGSMAHAQMLGEVGLLDAEECAAILGGLREIAAEAAAGRWSPDPSQEDIHMAVEARLVEQIGAAGKKLHTARSRNDQIATAVRLWMRAQVDTLVASIESLLSTLLQRIEADGRVLMPGYTHLQRGQPIWLGHHLLAHCGALLRDRERLIDARRRINRCPLGAGAMAGTPHPIRRHRTAELLGFDGLVENAMDAVSARDHQTELTAACAICMTHLSRMAEELVLWTSAEFAFLRLPDSLTTGSSIMPQKRNPDAAELARGKSARVIGDLTCLLSLVKGLPMAYNRDLQEDRHALMDAIATTLDTLAIMDAQWRDLKVHGERFEQALQGDFLLATELADHLASHGVPFREAYAITGQIVRWCEQQGGNLGLLDRARAREFHPALDTDLETLLDPRQAVERRRSTGGTAWCEIEKQLRQIRQTLGTAG